MAIILYGQWIAFSVAEEKSTRVMEIVLAAATPFQLLAGKVIGVGALALHAVRDRRRAVDPGRRLPGPDRRPRCSAARAAGGLPSGCRSRCSSRSGGMLVLGFALYASLYAGAASLVSRQEDVN